MSSENNNNNPNEKGYERKLTCSQRVFDIITIRCIDEFKKQMKELECNDCIQSEYNNNKQNELNEIIEMIKKLRCYKKDTNKKNEILEKLQKYV